MIDQATEVQGVTTCYLNMEPGIYMDKNSYGVIGKFKFNHLLKYMYVLPNESKNILTLFKHQDDYSIEYMYVSQTFYK